jgi:hypothetical protein
MYNSHNPTPTDDWLLPSVICSRIPMDKNKQLFCLMLMKPVFLQFASLVKFKKQYISGLMLKEDLCIDITFYLS